MLPGPIVSVLLGQSKVNEEQLITVTSYSHQKVIGLYVAMDKVLVVDKLNAANHLVSQHQNRLHCESSRTEIEQIFQAGPQQIHNKHVVIAFLAIPKLGVERERE